MLSNRGIVNKENSGTVGVEVGYGLLVTVKSIVLLPTIRHSWIDHIGTKPLLQWWILSGDDPMGYHLKLNYSPPNLAVP